MPSISAVSSPAGASHVHALLRDATAEAHAQLEDGLALLQPPLLRERFAAVIAGFHGFHQVWEPALAAALCDPAFTAPRRRLATLDHDLLALGARTSPPACREATVLCDGRDAALGSLYVMEGSTLGGRVIDKQLARAPWCPPGGLRYFSGHGADTGRLWRETLALIGAQARDPHQVAAGALRTFALLQRWLAPAARRAAASPAALQAADA